MKKILIWCIAALASNLLFTACESDRDANPTIEVPETFQLFTPSTANLPLDLKASSDMIGLTYEEAYFGFPCVQTYMTQISKSESFGDNESYTLDAFTSTVNSIEIGVKEINAALNSIFGYEKDATPEVQSVYIRMIATVGSEKTYSNAVKMNFKPYFFDPNAAKETPAIWWFIGSCIADGAWGGDQVYPMAYSADMSKFQSTVFLTSAGFKMVKFPGKWDDQIGQGDAWGSFAVNDGGSGNITVPADGYYVVTMDPEDVAGISITEYTGDAPEVVSGMFISGNFQGWSADATPMKAVNVVDGVNNHIWFYEIPAISDVAGTDAETDGFIKFKLNPNWIGPEQASSIYCGTGVTYEIDGDKNFVLPAEVCETPTKVYYNDIDKSYTIVK